VAVHLTLPAFEGPFDLLLHLVRQQEMDLDDIRVAEITAQYLEVIEQMRDADLELGGEFLVMAATLIQVKARQLLPVPPNQEETDEAFEEILTTRDLVRQLMEYRLFKEAAGHLRDREGEAARCFMRQSLTLAPRPDADEPLRGDLNALLQAFSRVLRYVEQHQYDPKAYEAFSVEDKLVQLEEVLSASDGPVVLEALMEKCVHRAEVIVTFLAILELCRMKRVAIDQTGAFESVGLQWLHGSLGLDTDMDDDQADLFDDGTDANRTNGQDEDEDARPKRRRAKREDGSDHA
jgi:segregation and condensation protein A